jgi:hypothetical protein
LVNLYVAGASYWPRPKQEADGELLRWSRRRDRTLVKLQAIVAALTDKELDLIRRRYQPDQLKAQIAEFGVEARW